MSPDQPKVSLPHDIRALLPVGADWLFWTLALLALAVAIGLGIKGWQVRKRRRPPAAPVDPWDRLVSEVRALTPAQPFDTTAQEQFFYRLSLLLREGIERRTSIRATDLTYRELAEPLTQFLPLARGEIERVLALLGRADLIKFAASPSDVNEAHASAADVCRWLEALRPLSIHAAPTGEVSHASS